MSPPFFTLVLLMRFGTYHFFDTFFWHASAQPTDVSQHFRENLGAHIFFVTVEDHIIGNLKENMIFLEVIPYVPS